MAGTRQSARVAAQNNNSSPPSATPTSGTKRKADATSPSSKSKAKREKTEKPQKTLEEVIPDENKREEVKEALSNEAQGEGKQGTSQGGDESKPEGVDANGAAGMFLVIDYSVATLTDRCGIRR